MVNGLFSQCIFTRASVLLNVFQLYLERNDEFLNSVGNFKLFTSTYLQFCYICQWWHIYSFTSVSIIQLKNEKMVEKRFLHWFYLHFGCITLSDGVKNVSTFFRIKFKFNTINNNIVHNAQANVHFKYNLLWLE